MTGGPFDDVPIIGLMTPEEVAAKLRSLGEPELATRIEDASTTQSFPTFGRGFDWWPFHDRAWQHTAHAFGFLPASTGTAPHPIQGIGNVQADPSLKHGRIKISLNRLRIADYPGFGTHRVLIDFYARNQVPENVEDLHFNATYRVREGEGAPIVGYPIFIGLNVGSEGVAFHCHTVNVKNDADEVFLDFLEGDVFKAGLKLATTAQSAIAPLSSLAIALTKSIAKRNRNVSVQDFYLGLDFVGTAMGARLAQGDYIAVQIPESFARVWRWNDWVYDPSTGMIVSKNNPDELVPYNYLVFGVSRFEAE
jgi:hypothetical protein